MTLQTLLSFQGNLVSKVGLRLTVNLVIALQIFFPAICILFLHYPVDGGFSIYNLCIGRHELSYDLTDFRRPRLFGYHPCANNDVSTWPRYFWKQGCVASQIVSYVVCSNLIEVYLYFKCFSKINRHFESQEYTKIMSTQVWMISLRFASIIKEVMLRA